MVFKTYKTQNYDHTKNIKHKFPVIKKIKHKFPVIKTHKT